MPINALGTYRANHKSWDHVGNIIPDVEHSEGIRPAGHFRPAAWLPVQFFDKYFENWIVTMPGKAVAFDNSGRIVPAQYGLAGATITYTSNDVDAGVFDVRTGDLLTSAGIGTFTVASVASFMGTGEAMAVSKFVGFAPYAYLQWAGDGGPLDDGFNPLAYNKHNYNMQHQVAFVTDYVLALPLVPAQTSAENLTESAWANDVSTFNAVANTPVATATMRTPITFADGTETDADVRFVNQVTDVADIAGMGDWHINYETGIISVYKVGAGFGAGNLYATDYSHYAAAPTGSAVSRFACVLGDVKPGDMLVVNADSNLVKDPGGSDLTDIAGQALELMNVRGRDGLDKVRTAFDNLDTNAAGSKPGYLGQMDQMAGSANGGVPAKVHYAGGADLIVTVNLISR